MFKKKYVIVTLPTQKGGSFSLIGLKSSKRSSSSEIRIDELSEVDAVRINKEGDRLAVPSYPLRLLRPTEERTAGATKSSLWSLEKTGVLATQYRGDGAKVAVIDTGIQGDHEAFSHLGRRLVTKDFTGEDPSNKAVDKDGHGTHCAGTLFGSSVGGRRIGVAPDVSSALVAKVIGADGARVEALISAINWAAEQGANVISMSLGMDFVGYQEELVQAGVPSDIATSQALDGYLQNARLFSKLTAWHIERAKFEGSAIIIAAASGNESRRLDGTSYKVTVAPPAVGEGIVSVGALRLEKKGIRVSDFSNSGATVSAPGSNIISAKLGGGLVENDGTSMATPLAAGIAALWWQHLQLKGQLNQDSLLSSFLGHAAKVDGDIADVGVGMATAPA